MTWSRPVPRATARLGNDLQGHELEFLRAMPHCQSPSRVKDRSLDRLRALRARLLQRPASCRVRLLHEDQRRAQRERRADLSEAVLRREWEGESMMRAAAREVGGGVVAPSSENSPSR